MLKTERLILRKWTDADADSLYEYAKDPAVGSIAGWPPHKSKEESLDVIRNVPVPLMDEFRIGHTNVMTKEQWNRLCQGEKKF